jgi:hypothetical protein
VLLNAEKGAEDISGSGGRRKSLKRLNSDKEIQGKPNRFLDCLCGLGPGLAQFGFGLDRAWPNFNMHNTESVHANGRRKRYKRVAPWPDARQEPVRFCAAFDGARERPIIVGQARFGSVATEDERLITAARYVALSPVRARSVDRAENRRRPGVATAPAISARRRRFLWETFCRFFFIGKQNRAMVDHRWMKGASQAPDGKRPQSASHGRTKGIELKRQAFRR